MATLPAAVILAGGQARRMGGGDKALLPLHGRPLLDHVLARLCPQVGAVALSANGEARRFAAWALPVLPDATPALSLGPLAGVLAGLRWAERQGAALLLSAPADTPFLPPDLVARLLAARGAAAVVCAASAGRRHPVVALWPVALADGLAAALAAGHGKVEAYAASCGLAEAAFAVDDYVEAWGDPFFNINTPADLATASRSATVIKR